LSDTGIESLKMPVRVGTYDTSFNPRIENGEDTVNDPIFSSCLGNLIGEQESNMVAPVLGEQRRKKSFADFIKSLFFGGVEDEF